VRGGLWSIKTGDDGTSWSPESIVVDLKGALFMSRMGDQGNTGNQGGQGQGIGEAATQVGQNLRDLGGQVRDMAGERYGQLRDQATQYYDQGKQRAQEWEEGLESYVHEKPLQAVLIAAGVGVLLGLLWKRS
jgi:ElaB/YqjD/DUF883 family membrane-anchored ribosome-binding protein